MSRDVKVLAEAMRRDWNRRVAHDYLFWMSDAHADLEAMWVAGERDIAQLFQDLDLPQTATGVELGCGVGRLIKAARKRLGRVIGLDVSQEALTKARELLGEDDGVEFSLGNGIDFNGIGTGAVDFVYSFAAISSIPTQVVAHYFLDTYRILRPRGVFRMQLYLGSEQPVDPADTLHLRCYPEDGLCSALALAGFAVEWVRPLALPFKVSFEELSIHAMIVSARRLDDVKLASADDIERSLLPSGPESSDQAGIITDLEAFMTSRHAEDLYAQGDYERAREAATYALQVTRSSGIDISDLLERIVSKSGAELSKLDHQKIEVAEQLTKIPATPQFQQLRNAIAANRQRSSASSTVEVRRTKDGPVILVGGMHLDHATAPREAARVWVERSLPIDYQCTTPVVVFGVAAGYHVEALLDHGVRRLIVIEPNAEVACAALSSRDMSHVLTQVEAFIVGEDLQALNTILKSLDGTPVLLTRPPSYALAVGYHESVKVALYREAMFTQLQPKIAVLGPMMGGTLPLLPSVGRGIAANRGRVRAIDMQSFGAGFSALAEFARDPVRRALTQNRFLEVVSSLVIDQYHEKPFDILICLAQAPLAISTLEKLREQGVITVLWFVEDYLRFTYWQQLASHFDYVFTIQRGAAIDAIKQAGAGRVHYLPLACDPQVHVKQSLSLEEVERWGSQVSFVGAGYYNRQQMFAALAHYPFKIWGTEWPEGKPFDILVQEKGRRLTAEEYVKIFNATAVNLNLHSSTEKDGVDPFGDFVNPRTFELASSSAFQLVDERQLLPELFKCGEELITFSSTNDLKDKINHYLKNPDERVRIADLARQRTVTDHTYATRMRQMLAYIYSGHHSELMNRSSKSPWVPLMNRVPSGSELESRCKTALERGEEPTLDALVSDIVVGNGKLTETEQKLMFMYHVRKQTSQRGNAGETAP